MILNKIFQTTSYNAEISPLKKLSPEEHGKVYADVPLSYFASVDELKNYVVELKKMGVNVLLILPHFLPSFSAYVVKDYEKPCELFGTWENFAEFMKFVEEQGMDRMIDIPFNHANWEAENLKREWFKNYQDDGIEAGADDVDADNNKIRINWGAYILDNSIEELQNYWLEKVIYPHVEKYNVNCIRIDAAWGLDPEGLKNLVQKTKAKFPHVWFLAENLGMDKLINLAKSGIEAGADRYFNNMYWYTGGRYIPSDIYTFYKRSKGVPSCTLFSSHDVLMPAMNAYSVIRRENIKGMNDKAIIRQFVKYEGTKTISLLPQMDQDRIVHLMKLEFMLAALMTSDTMFVAGAEKALFEPVNVVESSPEDFKNGVDSDFSEFFKKIIDIKFSDKIFNTEGKIVPFGSWDKAIPGLKGYFKTTKDNKYLFIAVNTDLHHDVEMPIPERLKKTEKLEIVTPENTKKINTKDFTGPFYLEAGSAMIIKS